MRPYQKQYIDYTVEALQKSDFGSDLELGFEGWYRTRRESEERLRELRELGTALLNEHLFGELDDLYGANEQTIDDLFEFAETLLDWKTNLDPGVNACIHDALLHFYRTKHDRNRMLRELYKLGMGLYYQWRYVRGAEYTFSRPFMFDNEMVFTEAASYLRYFEEIDDEETKAYIIRSIANIALCVRNHKRKIAASRRSLEIIRDEHYRKLAPNLPWDRYERSSHQQMSSNRVSLSRGDLSQEELASVLDSCYEVFRVEDTAGSSNSRWLWPYYEMEFNCGYVGKEVTLERLEKLIRETNFPQYDLNGLYGNVHLLLVYERMISQYPEIGEDPKRLRFVEQGAERMLKTLLSFPAGSANDDLKHYMSNVIYHYTDIGNAIPFKTVILRLMQRFSGNLYIQGRLRGDILRCLCDELYRKDPAFFDDIPFLGALSGEEKRTKLLEYAGECGILCDIGLVKMGIEEIRVRRFFEKEDKMYRLHGAIGARDLERRESTRIYADVAFGHHSRYDGAEPDPGGYVRTESVYRQMTDAACVATFLLEQYAGNMDDVLEKLFGGEGTLFSPMVTAVFASDAFVGKVEKILSADPEPYYREAYNALAGTGD